MHHTPALKTYNLQSDYLCLKSGRVSSRYDNHVLVTYHFCAYFLSLKMDI